MADANKTNIPASLPQAVLEAVSKGRIIFYGEFRRGAASEFSGKNNKVYKQSKCTVETASGTVTVAEFLPENTDVNAWQPPFPKGTMVMCVVRTLEEASGVQVAQGKFFAV